MRKRCPGTTTQANMKGRLRVRIWAEGKTKTIGWFDTPEEAYAAYREAKAKYHDILLPELAEGRGCP